MKNYREWGGSRRGRPIYLGTNHMRDPPDWPAATLLPRLALWPGPRAQLRLLLHTIRYWSSRPRTHSSYKADTAASRRANKVHLDDERNHGPDPVQWWTSRLCSTLKPHPNPRACRCNERRRSGHPGRQDTGYGVALACMKCSFRKISELGSQGLDM